MKYATFQCSICGGEDRFAEIDIPVRLLCSYENINGLNARCEGEMILIKIENHD